MAILSYFIVVLLFLEIVEASINVVSSHLYNLLYYFFLTKFRWGYASFIPKWTRSGNERSICTNAIERERHWRG